MKASREFQVFAKPIGAICNLDCHYCYYLKKEQLYPEGESFRMPEDLLEEYIVQHIKAFPGPVIRFSWHGGEPTVLGLDYFRKIVAFQRKHQPPRQRIANGMQTNGTLLNDDWCRFLASMDFAVGLSLDGPTELHNLHRVTRNQQPTHEQVMRGYQLLQQYGIACDILCVVNAQNVQYPTQVYRFFKQINAQYVTFLPLVEPQLEVESGVSDLSVPAEAFGEFLCTIFDEWQAQDIGRIKVQIFEEAARTAFNQEHSLCIFRPVCGDIPVVEHNGDFFSCDHFVDPAHRLGNIRETPLIELLESQAQKAFGQAKLKALPRYCQVCEVRVMCHGECPKNRFIRTPDGKTGLNYLCAGYKCFFTHCQPFVQEVAAQWRRQTLAQQKIPAQATVVRQNPKVGRNDPCPCGSGLKYKKCCGR
ncbi:radical SAM domain protein [Candidatus Vecturithrix granuli]|uniref:Radical SAM domain protein n=1 Tax=Vecturithrix granuli TaxID=1499967 RepID=A0A081BYZ2_VECG1|nr:radical SAM domain protein [Candidatus Vecturithrix granuli]